MLFSGTDPEDVTLEKIITMPSVVGGVGEKVRSLSPFSFLESIGKALTL